jgi:hypothetical protein
LAIGAYGVSGAGKFNGRIKKLNIWAGASLVLPDAMELRTMHNDKGTGDNPFTQGEPYDPIVSASFYAKFEFGKSGVAPITVDSNVALAITMQGATAYTNYLNP